MGRLLCIAFTLVAISLGAAAADDPKKLADPDILYADREHLKSALEAASIWESRMNNDPKDFESTWKLARACYWLGGHVVEDEREAQHERGIEAGRKASKLQPQRPEGFFWMAANRGALAELSPWYMAAKHAGAVKKALEKVLELDQSFLQGSADRGLGRWNFKMAEQLGHGYWTDSVKHLLQSLEYDKESIASHYFLAETYRGMKKLDAARKEAQMVIDLPVHPEWAPEDLEFKQKARVLLDNL
jgi:tetratricopeptide (TPR) repeat protein